ncbi:hypothetical protein B9X71_07820 [Acinetobacter baumannii]|uniref:hypothetical protein n=1 Tax=Acinetobacter baumannii TaxID=470 RepID=UPI000A33ED06|nr:hypothetical protein [Acinetobacter baumannii]OTK48163.1 hypothetical protein B9X71_07820 [Acinetobacter baumannii]
MDIDKKIEILETCFLFYLYRMGRSEDSEKKVIVTTTEKIILSLLEIEKTSLKHQYGLGLSREKLGEFSACLENLRSLQTLNKGRYYYSIKSNPNSKVTPNEVEFSARTSLQHPLMAYTMSANIAKQINVDGNPSLRFLSSVFPNESHPLDTHNRSFLPSLKDQLNKYFHLDKTLKAVYVDLSYNFSEVSKELIKNHFSFFLQLLNEQRQYRGYFHKLDYSVTDGFSIFFIGLFENLKSVAINHYYLYIQQTWERAFEKLKASFDGLDCPSNLIAETKFRNIIADRYLFRNNIAIVGKEGENYQKFIEGPLAYIALIDEFLPIFLNGEELQGDLGVIAYPSVHNYQAFPIAKQTRKHKQKRIYDVKSDSLFKKYFSEISLLNPIKDDIRNICFCYEYIGEFLQQEEKEIWEKLLQIEVITLLAQHWKQPATEIIDGSIVHYDLGNLLISLIGSDPSLFRAHVIENNKLLGVRSTIFFKAFKKVEKDNLLRKSVVNEYIWFYRDLIDEIRNNLNLPIKSSLPLFELHTNTKDVCPEREELVVETQSQITKEQTVQEWLGIQERSRRQSFRKLDDYCRAMLNYKNVHKVIRIQLASEATQDIKILAFFDKSIRQSMDPLQRSFPAIQGYLGGWQFDFKNQCYYLELNVFLDSHYVDGNLQPLLECMREKINEKIKKNSEPSYALISNSQLHEVNLNDQSNTIAHILGKFMSYKISPKKINLNKYLRAWCFYLAHRDLYCFTYLLPISQKSIRGKMSYKARKVSETKASSI